MADLDDTRTDEGQQVDTTKAAKGRRALQMLAAYYLLLPVVLIYFLFSIFPPHPWWDTAHKDWTHRPMHFLFFAKEVWTTLDERLIILVIVMGALGSYIHTATSYATYRGNRQFSASWLTWYLLRPFVGVALALIVYFALRGGLLSMALTTAPETTEINPFGVGAIASLTGMFSKQAADKLAEVFNTLFKSAGDAQRGDSLAAPVPVILTIDKNTGSVAGGEKITITGTGFAAGAKVLIGGKAAANVEVINDTTITAETPVTDTAGTVDVEVENLDSQKGIMAGGYTYEAAGGGG